MLKRNLIAGATVALLTAASAPAQTGASSSDAFTVSAEALVVWYKSGSTPAPIIVDGPLADPDTQVLLGGGKLDTRRHGGLRLTLGREMGRRLTVEGSFLYAPTHRTSRSVASSGQLGSTDLLLPYIDVNGREATTEISLSPVYSGSAREELKSGLMGAELGGAWALLAGSPLRLEVLAGLRWMRLRETYTITTSSTFIPPNAVDIWSTTDAFEATNSFYGVQLGARARYDCRRFYGTGSLKVGVGAMRQVLRIDGFLETNDFSLAPITQPGQPLQYGPVETFAGGYFALPSNIGSHARTKVAVMPEVALNAGFRITPMISVFVGYTLLYTNEVVRPGEQVDRHINTTQNVAWVGDEALHPEGPDSPSVRFESSSFWAQSVSVGVGLTF